MDTAFEAGPALDARIAETLQLPPAAYSRDIAAAWRVVEVMSRDRQPRVNGLPGATAWANWWDKARLWASPAPEAAETICRAALTIVQDGHLPSGWI